MTYYEIFGECFPAFHMPEELFIRLSGLENGHVIRYEERGQLAGFALLRQDELRLLCVRPAFQGRGIGGFLLRQAEDRAKSHGEKKLLIGGTSSELLIGAPEAAVPFFVKRGYVVEGVCDEMSRTVQDFVTEDYHVHSPDGISFGWYQGALEELHHAVSEVERDWVQYFTESENVFCAFLNGEVASFCLVEYETDCLLSAEHNRVGAVGCVGTVPAYRNKGIGLKMVALATEELKRHQCDVCLIHYTGVSAWYEKLGYKTFLKQYFLTKTL